MLIGYRKVFLAFVFLVPMICSAQTQIGGGGTPGAGGSVNTTCNPVTLDSTGQIYCFNSLVSGTITGPGLGNGATAIRGDVSITMNSPNTSNSDYIGVSSIVNTIGTGSFTSTDGMWAFWGANLNNGSSWFNSTDFEAGRVGNLSGGTVNNSIGFASADQSNSATSFSYDFWAAIASAPSGGTVTAVQYAAGEGASPVGLANVDELYANSTSHRWTINNNNTGALSLVGISLAATSGHLPKFAANGIDIVDSGNCASGASPAVCGSASAGSVAVPTGTTPTLQINTTAITANSQILLTLDETLGTRLSVTCNTTLSNLVEPIVSARTAATSFTIQINATVTTNPACLNYLIVN